MNDAELESWLKSVQHRLESTTDIEFSLTLEDVRLYVLKNSKPYLPSRPIWFNAKIDRKTGDVIAAYVDKASNRHLNKEVKQNADIDSVSTCGFKN